MGGDVQLADYFLCDESCIVRYGRDNKVMGFFFFLSFFFTLLVRVRVRVRVLVRDRDPLHSIGAVWCGAV